MKRLGLLTILFVFLIMVSCSKEKVDSPEISQAPEQTSSEVVSTKLETQEEKSPDELNEKLKEMINNQECNYKYEMQKFEDGKISIEYPTITGFEHETLSDKVNKMIKDHAMGIVETNKVEGTEMTLDIETEVTLLNDSVLSVVFRGYGNFEQAAHPWNIISSLNIDLVKQEKIVLSDYIIIDENFLDNVLKSPKQGYDEVLKEEGLKYLTEDGRDDALDALYKIDQHDGYSHSYFKDGKIYISLPVMHLLGDDMEFEVLL